MKILRCIFILFAACWFVTAARADVNITNDTQVTTWCDSFGRAQFGQRQIFFLGSYFINYYPQFYISYRDHSRSGGANLEMLTNREPKFGLPDWAATHGKTNALNIYYVSSNGGPDSNTIHDLMGQTVLAPASIYTRLGYITNDWPQSSALFQSIIIGDIAYHALDGGSSANDRNGGARVAAAALGIPYVDSWSNLVNVVTNQFVHNPNSYWFNAPSLDHPGNELQFIWAMTTLRSLGVDTNTYTAILNFNAATVSSTNHCTVSSLSRSGNTLTFTFHADRMAPAFYVPDGTQTNDCRGGIDLMPSLGNQFCEILRVTNLPPGNYQITLDGSNCVQTTSAQLAAGFNWFTNYTGAFWAQKKEGLGLMCDMLAVDRANASDQTGLTKILFYESYANTVWATNDVSTASYLAQSDMVAREGELQAQDVPIHANAQQTNHTFSITLASPRLAPFHK